MDEFAIDAAEQFGKAFPMMMTAAGRVNPAKVMVLGVGVAGLQAIATAKRLGAVVSATDVRAAAEEQVKSLGGRFLKVDELASMVSWLVSEENSYTTGAVFDLSGGRATY